MNNREKLNNLIEAAAKNRNLPPDWELMKQVKKHKEEETTKNYQLYDR